MNQILIQGIGFIALALVILSFQKRDRVSLLTIMMSGLVLFVIHFSLLGAWAGAMMNLVEVVVVFVSFKRETAPWAKKAFWPYIFVVMYIAAGLFTFTNASDLLPVLAQIFGAIAVWQKSPRVIRYIMLVPRPLWFVYNIIVGSYAGVITELLILLSVVIGIIRFDILGQHDPDLVK